MSAAAALFESTVTHGGAARGSVGHAGPGRIVLAMGVVGRHDEDARVATAVARAFVDGLPAAPLTAADVAAVTSRAVASHPGAGLWFSTLEVVDSGACRVLHVGPFRVCRLSADRDIADVVVPHTVAAALADGGGARAAQLATIATRIADGSLVPSDVANAMVTLEPGEALAVLSNPASLPASGLVAPDRAVASIRAAVPDPAHHLARFVPYALVRRVA